VDSVSLVLAQRGKDGTAKAITYFESNGKMAKVEVSEPMSLPRKNRIVKAISYLDSNKKIVKTEFYDKNGKLLKNKTP